MKISLISTALSVCIMTFVGCSPAFSEASKTASNVETSAKQNEAEFEPDALAIDNNKAIQSYKNKNYADAEATLKKVIEDLGRENSDLSKSEVLANYSIVLKADGKEKESAESLAEAKAIRTHLHMPALASTLVDILPTATVRKQATERVREASEILEGKDSMFPAGSIKDLSAQGWNAAMAAAEQQRKANDLNGEMRSLRKAIMIANATKRPNPKIVASMNMLADLYRHMQRPYSARMLFLECVAEHEKLGLTDNTDYASLLDHTAQTMIVLHDEAEAERLLEKSVAIYKKHLGAGSADEAMTLCTLGELYTKQKETAKAEKTLSDAVAMMTKTMKESDPRLLIAEDMLANLYAKNNKLKEAELLQTSILQKSERTYKKPCADLIFAVHNLAHTLAKEGKFQEAEPLMKRAVDLNKELYGPNSVRTKAATKAYANTLEKLGKKEEADKLLK